MKNLRKSAATVVLAAGCLLGIAANAKALLIDAGYYQIPATGTPSPQGDVLSGSPSSYCLTPTTPNCVAEFDSDGNLVPNTLIQGTFTNP